VAVNLKALRCEERKGIKETDTEFSEDRMDAGEWVMSLLISTFHPVLRCR
jgi:hypothetical protein